MRWRKKDQKTALNFVAKTGRELDTAGTEYLYRLYTSDVIPPRPRVRPETIELALQMTGSSPSLKAQDVMDTALVPELENEGRCNF